MWSKYELIGRPNSSLLEQVLGYTPLTWMNAEGSKCGFHGTTVKVFSEIQM